MRLALLTCIASLALGHSAPARQIARQEGFYAPGSLPQRYHNPGALVYAHQRGAQRGWHGFAIFESAAAGWRALERDIATKLRRGVCLGDIWKGVPCK